MTTLGFPPSAAFLSALIPSAIVLVLAIVFAPQFIFLKPIFWAHSRKHCLQNMM
jgi:hypothetical protein